MIQRSKFQFFSALSLILAVIAPSFSEAGTPGVSPGRKYSSIERMTLPRLEAVHRDVEALKEKRREVSLSADLQDFRGILHAHAEDSSHTGGTLPEMLEDAKKAGVDVILLSDHFRPPRDFMQGWRGIKEGVLFIPGSETHGFVIHPMDSMMDEMEWEGAPFIEKVTEGEGLIFLSHIEARPDHPMDGLTGMEIYNRHADAMDDAPSILALYQFMTDPEKIPDMLEAIRLYPHGLLAAHQDYPQEYIAKWDSETLKRRVVGIAANDCHHNQVYIAKMVDEETILAGTVVDSDDAMKRITSRMRPAISEMTQGRQPGDILVEFDLDPYHIFFHNVSTHILASELTEEAIRASLKAGNCYVAHDWMCDPTGFLVGVASEDEPRSLIALMGDEVPHAEGRMLVAEFPVECRMKLFHNGRVVLEQEGRELAFPIVEPGVHRLEAWIYANPVYIR